MPVRSRSSDRRDVRWGAGPLFSRALRVSEAGPGRDTSRKRGSDRRERSSTAIGILCAVALHALLIALWPAPELAPDRGIDGPRRSSLIPLSAIRAVAVVEPEHPAPAVEELLPAVEVEVPHIVARREAPARPRLALRPVEAAPAVWSPTLPAPVSAVPAPPGRYATPAARTILPSWKIPRDFMGLEVRVRVHVDAQGKPTGPVVVDPPEIEGGIRRALARHVRGLPYNPAMENDRPVESWAEIGFRFCPGAITASSPAGATFGERPCRPRGGNR